MFVSKIQILFLTSLTSLQLLREGQVWKAKWLRLLSLSAGKQHEKYLIFRGGVTSIPMGTSVLLNKTPEIWKTPMFINWVEITGPTQDIIWPTHLIGRSPFTLYIQSICSFTPGSITPVLICGYLCINKGQKAKRSYKRTQDTNRSKKSLIH